MRREATPARAVQHRRRRVCRACLPPDSGGRRRAEPCGILASYASPRDLPRGGGVGRRRLRADQPLRPRDARGLPGAGDGQRHHPGGEGAGGPEHGRRLRGRRRALVRLRRPGEHAVLRPRAELLQRRRRRSRGLRESCCARWPPATPPPPSARRARPPAAPASSRSSTSRPGPTAWSCCATASPSRCRATSTSRPAAPSTSALCAASTPRRRRARCSASCPRACASRPASGSPPSPSRAATPRCTTRWRRP